VIAGGLLALAASLTGCCVGCVKAAANCANPCSETCLQVHREATLGAQGLMRRMYDCPRAKPATD
jgi:hypothetical protein